MLYIQEIHGRQTCVNQVPVAQPKPPCLPFLCGLEPCDVPDFVSSGHSIGQSLSTARPCGAVPASSPSLWSISFPWSPVPAHPFDLHLTPVTWRSRGLIGSWFQSVVNWIHSRNIMAEGPGGGQSCSAHSGQETEQRCSTKEEGVRDHTNPQGCDPPDSPTSVFRQTRSQSSRHSTLNATEWRSLARPGGPL